MRVLLCCMLVAAATPLAAQARPELAAQAEAAERRGDRGRATSLAEGLTEQARSGTAGWSGADRVALGRAWLLLSAARPDAVRSALAAFDGVPDDDPAATEARLRAADLLLDKYNAPDARSGYEGVLRREPRNGWARLGLARLDAFEGKAGALQGARAAVSTDPALAAGWLLLARLHLEAESYDSADAAARRALALDSTDVTGWATLGATAWLRGDSAAYRRAEAGARGVNPRDADFFTTIAEAAARQRRYDDAVTLAGRAVALDSSSARALGVLGDNELRLGRMTEGRAHVERAFALDAYNLWHKNLLDLLDKVDKYVTIESPRFRIVAAPEDAEYVRLYLPTLLEEAYDSLAARYGWRPPAPIRLEVYRRHADFSVRTVGLAGLGALGVSFGGVLAMDGPTARDPGEFNFGSTAWHELAHTFTLGLSANRTPRWLSEGLSVLEERRARHGWGADATADFVAAIKGGTLKPVSRISEGLVRPAHPDEIGWSYYEASLVCEMIEQEHGIEALRALLRAFRDGLDAPAAFRKVVGLGPQELDAHFAAWLRRRFAVPLAAFDSLPGYQVAGAFPEAMTRATALLQRGRADSAQRAFAEADRLFPGYSGGDGPSYSLAILRRDAGDAKGAADVLRNVTLHNETALEPNLLEATLRRQLGDARGEAEALERIIWMAPGDVESHRRLAEASEASDDWARAIRERRALLALGPADRIEARYQLARVLAKGGARDAARRELLQLLEQAPSFEKAQTLLLELRTPAPGGGM